jgi:hypothetical protein
MEVGGQCHAPAALPPEKSRYPLYGRLVGPQGRSGRVRKISHPPRFDLWTVQARSEWPYRLRYRGSPPITLTYRNYRCTLCRVTSNVFLIYSLFISTLILLTHYFAGDKIEKHEMGEACIADGGGERRV